MTEYDTFVFQLSDLKQMEEVELSIRDCETYDARMVKAMLSSKPDEFPDKIFVRSSRGQILTKVPWTIKIIEELGSLLEKTGGPGTG